MRFMRITSECGVLFLLSFTPSVLGLCVPNAPCKSCGFMSIERDLSECQLYHYCFYGRLVATRSCGYNQVYSTRIYACIPTLDNSSADLCLRIPSVTGKPSASLVVFLPTQQSTFWRDDAQNKREPNNALHSTAIVTSTQTTPVQDVMDKFKPEDKCGIKVTRYIIGGQRADRAEWAWQVSLQAYDVTTNGFRHICGGTLIHDSWVVTAAHCVYSSKTQSRGFLVVAGQYRLHTQDPWRQIRTVDKTVLHFGYRHRGNYPNDIALLKISTPFNVTTAVRPACLPQTSDFPESSTHSVPNGQGLTNGESSKRNDANTKCWTTGWGKGQGLGGVSLREVNVRFISPARCRKQWPGYIKHFHICAVSSHGTACKGDSGGPLVCVDNGRYFLQGVVSWGQGSCDVTNPVPTVYTRVADYIGWIRYFIDRYS